MDYTTDDVPAGLKIVEHPPGRFAWVIDAPRDAPRDTPRDLVPGAPPTGAGLTVPSQDGYGSYEEAMKAGRAALGLPSQE